MASKKSINAFSLFLSDKKNQNPSMSKAELSSMYQEEYEQVKDKYKKRAKAMKSGSYAGKDIQCDSMGNSLKLIRSAEKDKQQKFDEMIAYIKEFVETNGAVALRSHKFLVIYVSQYIHTNTGDIHPAEIAICKFSFENGVDEIYHAIILADLVTGYAYEALQHSRKTHNIYNEACSSQLSKENVANQLIQLTENQEEPLLCFTEFERIEKVEKGLEHLDDTMEKLHSRRVQQIQAHGTKMPVPQMPPKIRPRFLIYSLDHLYFHLYNEITKSSSAIPLCIAQDHLRASTYEYERSIACKFHRDTKPDASNYCALSNCKKWYYNMVSQFNMTKWLNITFDVNIHIPPTYVNPAELNSSQNETMSESNRSNWDTNLDTTCQTTTQTETMSESGRSNWDTNLDTTCQTTTSESDYKIDDDTVSQSGMSAVSLDTTISALGQLSTHERNKLPNWALVKKKDESFSLTSCDEEFPPL